MYTVHIPAHFFNQTCYCKIPYCQLVKAFPYKSFFSISWYATLVTEQSELPRLLLIILTTFSLLMTIYTGTLSWLTSITTPEMLWIGNHFSECNYSTQRRTLWVDNPSEIGGRIYVQFTAFREWRCLWVHSESQWKQAFRCSFVRSLTYGMHFTFRCSYPVRKPEFGVVAWS